MKLKKESSSSRILTPRNFVSTTYVNQSWKYFWAYLYQYRTTQSLIMLKLDGAYIADAEYYIHRDITELQDKFFLDIKLWELNTGISEKHKIYDSFLEMINLFKEVDIIFDNPYINPYKEGNFILPINLPNGFIKNLINGQYSKLLLGSKDLLIGNMEKLGVKNRASPIIEALYHGILSVLNTNESKDYFIDLMCKKYPEDAEIIRNNKVLECDIQMRIEDEVINYSHEFAVLVGLKTI
jgi:hypothetical protein